MSVLAIDPGPTHSALVFYDGEAREVSGHATLDNYEMLGQLGGVASWQPMPDECVVEMIASYGMAVGAEVFDTCVWIGRFVERWNHATLWRASTPPADLMLRRAVKLHLCGATNAKDGNIRQALIDKFGGKERAIGKKAKPGPLYGIKADEWQALALAVTYAETRQASKEAA